MAVVRPGGEATRAEIQSATGTSRHVTPPLGSIQVWHRELEEDLIAKPSDLELLAEEEVVALLLDRVERARIAA